MRSSASTNSLENFPVSQSLKHCHFCCCFVTWTFVFSFLLGSKFYDEKSDNFSITHSQTVPSTNMCAQNMVKNLAELLNITH